MQRVQVRRSQSGAGVLLAGAMLLLVQGAAAATGERDAVVTGVVRDSEGVVQMGALVQVLAGGSRTVASAFTDLHGRYAFDHLIPGRYQVKASAALFVPATRSNLQLGNGAKAVVNLTLAALFDTASWLPANRRRADEPADDWQWTLRSAANRPILRIVDDDGVLVLSSVPEAPRGRLVVHDAVTAGDGGFGRGGVENVITLHRSLPSGIESTVRAGMQSPAGLSRGSAASAPALEPALDVQAGFERQNGYGGGSRTVVAYASHPQLAGPGGSGMQVLELRSGEQIALGENVELEVGSEALGVHSGGKADGGAYTLAAHPFLRLTAHPGGAPGAGGGSWRVQYRMATSRDTQEFADVKAQRSTVPVAIVQDGRLALEAGRHQEISVSRSAAHSVVEIAYYRDAMQRTAISGIGASSEDDEAGMMPAGFLLDPSTGSFRGLAAGYNANGARITVSAPLSPQVWVAAEYAGGEALASGPGSSAILSSALGSLKPVSGQAAAVALKGDLKRSGTQIRASYRWQPSAMLTAIDPYGALGDQAFASCMVRQRLHLGSWLPPGFDATIDVTNLLAQGYRPFLSSDGRTLYLEQAPRTIQAGLSFNF